jgi:hypothetical protein
LPEGMAGMTRLHEMIAEHLDRGLDTTLAVSHNVRDAA